MALKLKALILASGLAATALIAAGSPAQALVYRFSFVADINSATDANYGAFNAVGVFTTAAAALPSAITGVSGAVTSDGTSGIIGGAISGLSPYAAADNLLFSTVAPGQASFSGVSFTVGSQAFNIYQWNGADYALASIVDSIGYPENGVIGTFTVTPAPELSTWAMMGLGLAALAFAGRRSARREILPEN
jgi:hypothetical protein